MTLYMRHHMIDIVADYQVGDLQSQINVAYNAAFQNLDLPEEAKAAEQALEDFSEAAFALLGRDDPKVYLLLDLCDSAKTFSWSRTLSVALCIKFALASCSCFIP